MERPQWKFSEPEVKLAVNFLLSCSRSNFIKKSEMGNRLVNAAFVFLIILNAEVAARSYWDAISDTVSDHYGSAKG